MAGFGSGSLMILTNRLGWHPVGNTMTSVTTQGATSPSTDDGVRKILVRTNTDMGAAFKKKNKRVTHPTPGKSNSLDDPCTVVVHEYGPDDYIRHESTQKFSSVDQMLEELPVLATERPGWANVR